MALLDYMCQLIYRKITGKGIQYEAESSGEGGQTDPEDFTEDSDPPDYSIGVILTYRSQVVLLN